MSNEYQKAYEYVKNAQKKGLIQNCCCSVLVKGPTGPMGPAGVEGPTGPTGPAVTLEIGSVTLGDNISDVSIDDIGTGSDHVLNFVIPKGEMGPKGDIGPTGPSGTSVTILGSFDTEEDLRKNHPTGKAGESYLVGDNLYVWVDDNWQDVGVIRGPRGLEGPTGPIGPTGQRGIQGIQGIPGVNGNDGPTGPTGPTGPKGSLEIGNAYIVTFNTNSEVGVPIGSYHRLPLERKDIDNLDICTLTPYNTILFKQGGVYKVNFVVNIQTNNNMTTLQDRTYSVGFKKVAERIIYAGDAIYANPTDQNIKLVGQGLFVIKEPIKEEMELVNLSNHDIILNSPSIDYLDTDSYFANPVISMVIQYLG